MYSANSGGLPLLEEDDSDEEKLVKLLEVRELQKKYSKQELDELLEAPCTIHYYPPPKPARRPPPQAPAGFPPEQYQPAEYPHSRRSRHHRRHRHPGYHPQPVPPQPPVEFDDDSGWSIEDPAYHYPEVADPMARVRPPVKAPRYQSAGAGPVRYYYDDRDGSPDVMEIPPPHQPPYEEMVPVDGSPGHSVSPHPVSKKKKHPSYSIQSQTILHRRAGGPKGPDSYKYQHQVLFEERGTLPKAPVEALVTEPIVAAVPLPVDVSVPVQQAQFTARTSSTSTTSSSEAPRVSGVPVKPELEPQVAADHILEPSSSTKKRSRSETDLAQPSGKPSKKKASQKSCTDYLTPFQYFKLIERGKRMFLFEDKDTDKDVDLLQQKWKDLSNFEKSPYFTLASMPFRKHIKGQLKDRTFEDQAPVLIVPQDPVGKGSRHARNLTKTVIDPIVASLPAGDEGVKIPKKTSGENAKSIRVKPEDFVAAPIVAPTSSKDDSSSDVDFAPHYMDILKRMQN